MRDPQQLLDGGATELELSLLRAGDAELPSPAARRAAAAALGLAAAVTASSLVGSAATGQSAAQAGKLLAAKWWLIGSLVGAGASVGYVTLATPEAPLSAPPGSASSPQPVEAPPRPEVPEVLPVERALPIVSSAPEQARVRAPRAAATTASGIQEQVALIDRARSAAASGQLDATSSALDEYQRRFPRGVLQQEAAILRIEAALARGDKATAARLGTAFLREYPHSALAARVKELLGD